MREPGSLAQLELSRWDAPPTQQQRERAIDAVESGGVLFLPRLSFEIDAGEQRFLSLQWSDGRAKNISLDAATGRLSGAQGSAPDLEALARMIARFASVANTLAASLFPAYAQAMPKARTSFRPVPASARESSRRKDDRLLHVDAFPSRPSHGERILRVFSNVNPAGEARVWRLGEPFEDVAARYVPDIARPLPGSARMLAALGVTKGVRDPYDHIMLKLHDRMKADASYQSYAVSTEAEFPPGSSWICFSDQVSHAVIRGQHALEHTLLVPVSAMYAPQRAPLRVLEKLTGRALA